MKNLKDIIIERLHITKDTGNDMNDSSLDAIPELIDSFLLNTYKLECPKDYTLNITDKNEYTFMIKYIFNELHEQGSKTFINNTTYRFDDIYNSIRYMLKDGDWEESLVASHTDYASKSYTFMFKKINKVDLNKKWNP